MKVGELIDKLKEFNSDREVIVYDSNAGLDYYTSDCFDDYTRDKQLVVFIEAGQLC